jgi:hypothetical protein
MYVPLTVKRESYSSSHDCQEENEEIKGSLIRAMVNNPGDQNTTKSSVLGGPARSADSATRIIEMAQLASRTAER